MLAGLVAYILIAFGLERAFTPDAAVVLGPVSALLMACVPAMLWLGYFYSQDRIEPEPRAYVLGCYVIGGFVAAPCASFLVGLATGPESHGLGMNALSLDRWIFAIAVVGLAQEASKYITVRYTMYVSPEFDEPLDGIIYMSAAGIGFATYESLQYLLGSGGEIFLSAAAAQCVVTTLAHASFAGVMGFAMGRAKFHGSSAPRRSLTLLIGLAAAAVLNGGFQMIMDALNVQGLDTPPWERVLSSFGFAAGVFIITSILMRRLLAISPHAANPSRGASDE